MTRQARPDLRERMQKVASKPAQHPDRPRRTQAAASRGTGAARKRSTGAARKRGTAAARSATPRRTRAATPRAAPVELDVDPEVPYEPEVNGKTRAETLAGWFVWEMVSVPRTRLRYLRDLLLGG